MSAIINPRTGRPITAAPPELVAPTGEPVSKLKRDLVSPSNTRTTREWQTLFRELQSRVRESFIKSFHEANQEAIESRISWMVHMITFDELAEKLQDDLELRGPNVFIYGWPVFPMAALLPGAVRVDFAIIAAKTTPEFMEWIQKNQPAPSAEAEVAKAGGPCLPS
jgi:hypothetical protein